MINRFFHKVFDWIWVSSSDPTKVSLTVKAALTTGASALMTVIGFTHLNLDLGPAVNQVVNGVSTVVLDGLLIVGAVGTVVGGLTKIWKTITGKNAVTNPQP